MSYYFNKTISGQSFEQTIELVKEALKKEEASEFARFSKGVLVV